AHGVPPEPVLHYVVQRNVLIAIFLRDPKKLLLRVVPVLALPVAVRPLAEQRSWSGQFAIVGDDRVEIRAVHEVVVDRIRHFRTQIKRMYETVIEPAPRSVVPENPVAPARQQHRYRYVGIVLRKIDRFSPVVPNPALVLP